MAAWNIFDRLLVSIFIRTAGSSPGQRSAHITRDKRVSSPPGKCRQISMAFESTGLLGLTGAERMKVVVQLSRVLMQAAGVAAEERDDER